MPAIDIGAIGMDVTRFYVKRTAIEEEMGGVVLGVEPHAVVAFGLADDGIAREDQRRFGINTIEAVDGLALNRDMVDRGFGILKSRGIFEVIDLNAIGIGARRSHYIDATVFDEGRAVTRDTITVFLSMGDDSATTDIGDAGRLGIAQCANTSRTISTFGDEIAVVERETRGAVGRCTNDILRQGGVCSSGDERAVNGRTRHGVLTHIERVTVLVRRLGIERVVR